MKNNFDEPLFREFNFPTRDISGNVIKAGSSEVIGKTKVSIDEGSHDGVTVILKKDANDSIKEIKFVCSCGQTKSIILDYSE
ncbi:MAG: hypothetical protein P4L45_11955 [Ignavibacteriaceae bacterium]|nr:hypothetical protein [Ignavibacteriaceae bacterium]